MSVLGRMGRAAQGAMNMADKMSDLRQQEMQNEQTAVTTRRMQEDEIERKRMAEALRNMKDSQPQSAPQQGATVSYKAPEQAAPAAPKQEATISGDGYAKPAAPAAPLTSGTAPKRYSPTDYSENIRTLERLRGEELTRVNPQQRATRDVPLGSGGVADWLASGLPNNIYAQVADRNPNVERAIVAPGYTQQQIIPRGAQLADAPKEQTRTSIVPQGAQMQPSNVAIYDMSLAKLREMQAAEQRKLKESDAEIASWNEKNPRTAAAAPSGKNPQGSVVDPKSPQVKQALSSLEQKYGMPSGILTGVLMTESGGRARPNAEGSGANGFFQFMPDTAKQMGVKVGDFGSEAEGAAKYLTMLAQRNGGDWTKALANYGGFVTKDPTGYVNKVAAAAGWQGQQPIQVAQGAPVPQGQVPQQGAQEPQQPAPTMQSGDYQMAAVNPWIENQQIDYQMRMNELVAMNSGDPQMIMKARLENQGLKLKQFGNHMYAVSHAAARGNPQAVQELVGAYSSYTGTPYTVVPMSNGTVVLATQGQDGGLVPASKPMALQQLVSNISGSVIPGIRDQIIAINAKRAEAMATKAPDMLIQGSKNNTALRISNDRLQSNERNTDVTATGRIVQEQIRASNRPGSTNTVGFNPNTGNPIFKVNNRFYEEIPGTTTNGITSEPTYREFKLPYGADLSAGGDPSIMPTIAGDGVTQQEYASDPVLAYLD